MTATAEPEQVLPLVARVGGWYAVESSPGQTAWVVATRVEELDPDLHFITEPYTYRRERSFVFTALSGIYSGEQESNAPLIGGRLGYYLTDRYEIEAGLQFTRVDRQRDLVEDLFDLSLEESTFQILHYQTNVNVHLITGRRLAPYITGGIGTATSNAKTEMAWNAGVGTLFFVTTETAVRLDFRNYHFQTGNQFTRRAVDNLELGIGASFLF